MFWKTLRRLDFWGDPPGGSHTRPGGWENPHPRWSSRDALAALLLQSAGADVTVRNSAGLSPRDVAATVEIRSLLHDAESERARTAEL